MHRTRERRSRSASEAHRTQQGPTIGRQSVVVVLRLLLAADFVVHHRLPRCAHRLGLKTYFPHAPPPLGCCPATKKEPLSEEPMSLFENDKSAERLPVSLITGFLGSGKTTLLNRLLRHDDMSDSAVIINEYGEISLDHLLVERVDGEVAVLASGCICCTIRSDLEETLRALLVKRDRGEVPPFRRILVETTGLADPAPIVQLLLNNPLVSHFLRLDTV